MIVLLHILIAVTSVAYATWLYFSPSPAKLRVAYGLVATTVASGVYLVVAAPSHLAQACVTGLVYLGIVSAAILAARHKLAGLTDSHE